MPRGCGVSAVPSTATVSAKPCWCAIRPSMYPSTSRARRGGADPGPGEGLGPEALGHRRPQEAIPALGRIAEPEAPGHLRVDAPLAEVPARPLGALPLPPPPPLAPGRP